MKNHPQLAELKALKNIGNRTAERLLDAGIDTPAKLKKLGPKEALIRMWSASGGQMCLCSCLLYALEGAITGETWNLIPQTRKDELKKFMTDFRKSF